MSSQHSETLDNQSIRAGGSAVRTRPSGGQSSGITCISRAWFSARQQRVPNPGGNYKRHDHELNRGGRSHFLQESWLVASSM